MPRSERADPRLLTQQLSIGGDDWIMSTALACSCPPQLGQATVVIDGRCWATMSTVVGCGNLSSGMTLHQAKGDNAQFRDQIRQSIFCEEQMQPHDPVTVSGQLSCPPPGSFVAVSGHFFVAADTRGLAPDAAL